MSEPSVPVLAGCATTPAVSDDDAPCGPPVPALRREAILPRERRGGLGAVALLCSLAGVASGFALATTILATQLAQSESRMTRRVSAHGSHAVRERAFLGIQYLNADDGSARVTRVFGGTPAADIGLAAGDRILRYDRELLDQPWELGRVVRRSRIGYEATLLVRRGETTMILHPTLIGAMLRDE